jgi:hypothetical protein
LQRLLRGLMHGLVADEGDVFFARPKMRFFWTAALLFA